MGQYYFACGRLSSSSVVVCNTASRRVGRACGQSAAAGSGTWAVGRPTLHGGPVGLRPPLGQHFVFICTADWNTVWQRWHCNVWQKASRTTTADYDDALWRRANTSLPCWSAQLDAWRCRRHSFDTTASHCWRSKWRSCCMSHSLLIMVAWLPMPMVVTWVGFSVVFICLFVCLSVFTHNI